MIRWRYIVTRLIVIAAIVMLLRYTLAPVAKYASIRLLETATGARVQISGVRVSLFPPSVTYEGLRIADPSGGKSSPDAISADSIELDIDGEAFLHRRYVVRDGRVSGLRFGSDRITSDHFDHQPRAQKATTDAQWLSPLVNSLTDACRAKIEAFGSDLEMVKRADQIRRRWKSEYAMLTKRATELEASIQQIQSSAQGVDNPLRDLPRVEATLAKTRDVQNELLAVRTAIDEIPAQVQADLISMQTAKQTDIDRIDEISSIDMANFDDVGARLLADGVNQHVDRMRTYIDTARELGDWTIAAPTPSRGRGETIDLIGGYRPPSMLIRRCEVSGEFRAGAEPYQLTGVVENVTPEPRLRQSPFRARLKLQGPQVVRVDYMRDDSSVVVRESLTMHWPEIAAPETKLSDSRNVALDIRHGRMEVWAELNTVGEQLQGRLVSRRVGTKIHLQGDADVASGSVLSSLNRSLAGVDRVEVDAAFAGTWADMDVAISTNLTQVMKAGMDQAVAAQVMATRAQLAAKLNDTYQVQMAELQSFVAAEQTQARDSIARADTTIQTLSEKVRTQSGSAEAYLGRLRGSGLK